MSNLETTPKAPTQPEGIGALHGPSRPDMRAKTLDQFQAAITESSVQLARAFAILTQVGNESPTKKSDSFQGAQRHLAAAIAALEPIALVIEGQATQLPAIASWLNAATSGVRKLLTATEAVSRTEDPEIQSAKLKEVVFQFPSLTDALENLMRPPIQDARKQLRSE